MPRHYTDVTKEEFEEVLDKAVSYQEVDMQGVKERVYEVNLPREHLSVRIFSTVVGKHSRGCGNDAIRTVIWNDDIQEPVGGRTKTLRIGPTDANPHGWKSNLITKIADLLGNWRNEVYDNCPECGGQLCSRTGKYGEFKGCMNYPDCQYTEEV